MDENFYDSYFLRTQFFSKQTFFVHNYFLKRLLMLKFEQGTSSFVEVDKNYWSVIVLIHFIVNCGWLFHVYRYATTYQITVQRSLYAIYFLRNAVTLSTAHDFMNIFHMNI